MLIPCQLINIFGHVPSHPHPHPLNSMRHPRARSGDAIVKPVTSHAPSTGNVRTSGVSPKWATGNVQQMPAGHPFMQHKLITTHGQNINTGWDLEGEKVPHQGDHEEIISKSCLLRSWILFIFYLFNIQLYYWKRNNSLLNLKIQFSSRLHFQPFWPATKNAAL